MFSVPMDIVTHQVRWVRKECVAVNGQSRDLPLLSHFEGHIQKIGAGGGANGIRGHITPRMLGRLRACHSLPGTLVTNGGHFAQIRRALWCKWGHLGGWGDLEGI